MKLQSNKKLVASLGRSSLQFNLDAELEKHAWKKNCNIIEAEEMLKGKEAFTYLIRPSETGRNFAISFVQKNGLVKHDSFALINPQRGLFRNGMPHHVGALGKVIRDMMECGFDKGMPLSS